MKRLITRFAYGSILTNAVKSSVTQIPWGVRKHSTPFITLNIKELTSDEVARQLNTNIELHLLFQNRYDPSYIKRVIDNIDPDILDNSKVIELSEDKRYFHNYCRFQKTSCPKVLDDDKVIIVPLNVIADKYEDNLKRTIAPSVFAFFMFGSLSFIHICVSGQYSS